MQNKIPDWGVNFLTDWEDTALRNAVNVAKKTNTEILRDELDLPSELWVPREEEVVERIPSRRNSPYSFLIDSLPPARYSHQYEVGTPLCQIIPERIMTPPPPRIGVPGPSSSNAARADSPTLSLHSYQAIPTSHGNQVDEDGPPPEWLEQEDSENDVSSNANIPRDEMTKIAMELRKVDLASLKTDTSRSPKKCC